MKYRVTEKHPYLKEGILFELVCESADHGYHVFNIGTIQESLAAGINDDWLRNGWIEEIQETEFTENDIINFANFYKQNYGERQLGMTMKTALDFWVKTEKGIDDNELTKYKNEK